MRFTAGHYLRTSLERMGQAQALYRLGSAYALAMYTAGVAVECMLRAFKLRRDSTFDEKHDLKRLFRASGILNLDPDRLLESKLSEQQALAYVRDLQIAVNEIYLLWANDFRFASEQRLRSHLYRASELRARMKGDLLKSLARRLLDAAQGFIEKGHVLWTLSSRS